MDIFHLGGTVDGAGVVQRKTLRIVTGCVVSLNDRLAVFGARIEGRNGSARRRNRIWRSSRRAFAFVRVGTDMLYRGVDIDRKFHVPVAARFFNKVVEAVSVRIELGTRSADESRVTCMIGARQRSLGKIVQQMQPPVPRPAAFGERRNRRSSA